MKSKWIEHKGKKIFYQDFSALFYNASAVKDELKAVQEIVLKEPVNSVLVLSNFKDTQIGADLISALNEASSKTKDHVRKTAVLGVTGFKRTLGDMLTRLTGQQLRSSRLICRTPTPSIAAASFCLNRFSFSRCITSNLLNSLPLMFSS